MQKIVANCFLENMIKLNFLLAVRDFSATIKKLGCNAHASLKLEFSSFEDIRCTEREIEVVDVFKDCEFFLLHLYKSEEDLAERSGIKVDQLSLEISRRDYLHDISLKGELGERFIESVWMYLALASSGLVKANFSITLSSMNAEDLVRQHSSGAVLSRLLVDNFEFSFSS